MASDSVIHSMAGAAGGIVAMSVTYPLIFLSTRAAVETKKENKVCACTSPSFCQSDSLNSRHMRLSWT